MMNEVKLTLAISPYDHVEDLVTGRIVPDGIKLTALTLPIEEIFFRFLKHREWDVSELSFGKYASLVSQGDESLTAIPVFPSRIHRHSSVYVRRDGPVRTPADLAGKRIGLPEWAQTAAVYSRGFLTHQYDIDLASIEWVQAGVDQPGRNEKVRLRLPEGITLAPVMDATLSDMLRDGRLDAVLSARPPRCFQEKHPSIRRLFENFLEVEAAYYDETGIFPIMHVIAIRREVLERHPWAAMNLFKAFDEAKNRSLERALDATASRFPIPWSFVHAQRAQSRFGRDYWPYGIDDNRPTLDAFLQYAYEQGVCHRRLAVEELFPKQMQTTVKV
jgi:4,5-dihydroxyphthalate decarboxylase